MIRYLYLFLLIFCFSVSAQAQNESFGTNDPFNYEEEIKENLKVYPNPAISYFSVTENTVVHKLEVYNIIGRKMKDFKLDAGNKYDITDLNKGLYLVRLIDNKNKVVKTLRLQKK